MARDISEAEIERREKLRTLFPERLCADISEGAVKEFDLTFHNLSEHEVRLLAKLVWWF